MAEGSPKTFTITLANNTEIKKWPNDAVPAVTRGAATSIRGVTIHSRNGFNIQYSYRSAQITAATHHTLDAGLYKTLATDTEIADIYFRSANVAGDVIELETFGTMTDDSVKVGYTP